MATTCRTQKALLEEGNFLFPVRVRREIPTDSAARTSSSSPRLARREALRRASAATAALTLGAGIGILLRPDAADAAAPSPAQDQKIFNFALLLEYLQAAFYTEALKRGHLTGEVRRFAEVVSEHERAHVEYLRKALGAHARERPQFDFGDAVANEKAFLKSAVTLENTGVVAYNGQAANLTKPALAAAAEIVSVEGRHAAWISALAGQPPAPRAADVGLPAAEVVRALQATRFLKST
jgi:rubrerythrin